MRKYKALSVKQPWAALIANGRKTIETRRWATNYRGPLLICSSKSADRSAPKSVTMQWIAHESAGLRVARFHLLDRGVALCLVDLVGCERITREHSSSRLEADACCPVYEGLVCWHLDNVRRLKAPLPEVKGSLRLFNVELERVVFENGTDNNSS